MCGSVGQNCELMRLLLWVFYKLLLEKSRRLSICILHTLNYSCPTDVTCEGLQCPFSQLPALPFQLELCEQVFGLSPASVAQAVAQTNSYYGGQSPGATQVLFVNGECTTRA